MTIRHAEDEEFETAPKVDVIACLNIIEPPKLAERVGFAPLISDDILPGLGELEAYSCRTDDGVLFSLIRKPDDSLLNVYAAGIESLPIILSELGLDDSDVTWRCSSSIDF